MKNLLVIADHEQGKNSALTRAIQLQKLTGAKITLLGFCYADIHKLADTDYAKLSRNALENKLIKARKEQLNQYIKQKNIQPFNISIKTQWCKDIAPAINAYCNNHPVDLVIKSGHASGNTLNTSTDWQLLRKCSAPVMITANKSWKKKARIIAAVDLSTKTGSKAKLNHQILDHANALAAALNAEVFVSFVISVPQALVDMDIIDAKVYVKNAKAKLHNTIVDFCAKHSIAKDHMLIKQGKPDRIIPSIANKLKADAVITGTVGRKGLKGKLLGNTAESILQNLHTDIVAIKP